MAESVLALAPLPGRFTASELGQVEPVRKGPEAMAALIILCAKAIESLFAAAQALEAATPSQNPAQLDRHSETVRVAMQGGSPPN